MPPPGGRRSARGGHQSLSDWAPKNTSQYVRNEKGSKRLLRAFSHFRLKGGALSDERRVTAQAAALLIPFRRCAVLRLSTVISRARARVAVTRRSSLVNSRSSLNQRARFLVCVGRRFSRRSDQFPEQTWRAPACAVGKGVDYQHHTPPGIHPGN